MTDATTERAMTTTRVGRPEQADPLLEAVDEIGAHFTRMAAAGRRRLRDRAGEVHPELTPLGLAVLTTSRQAGLCQQSTVAACLHADKGAVSRAVTLLEHLGLIRREADPLDRRGQLLEVTPAGISALDADDARARQELHRRLGDWPIAEVELLRDLLARFNAAGEDGRPPVPSAAVTDTTSAR